MDQREKINGSISIFLILVLVPLYTCIYMVVGSVRYSAGRSRLLGIMNLNGNSALNHYDLTLKQQFDLFSMGEPEKELQERLEAQYLEMLIPQGQNPGIWKNVVSVQPDGYEVHYPDKAILARPEVLEPCLKEYMRERAPVLFARDFAKKYQEIGKTPKLVEKPSLFGRRRTPQFRFLASGYSGEELISGQFGGLKSLSEQKPEKTIRLDNQSVMALIGAEISTRIESYAAVPSPGGRSEPGKKVFQSILGAMGKEQLELEEYLANMFSCYTTSEKERSLSGKPYSGRAMYRGELEYLLYGADSKRANVIFAAQEILALRVYLNSLYAFSSPAIQAQAMEAAGPLVELTGVGAAAIAEALITMWVMAESVSDVQDLLQGGGVPFYKTDAAWKTGLSGSVSQGAGSPTDFTYKDYLKLFLLLRTAGTASRRAVLLRTAKLMQIVCVQARSDFDISRCYQQLELKAQVTAVGHRIRREEVYSY